MENPEEVLQWLEEVSRRRPAVIPRALDDYLAWVARTGEPVYRWPLVRTLLKEKLAAVVAEYRAQPPGLELPPCPNVPPFDCDDMRACFIAKLDSFRAPPFTVQRICELLAHPRKHYNRIDKFMRAFEKNILVVSTKRAEPFRHSSDVDSQLDGSDANDTEDNDCKERPIVHRQWSPETNGPLEPPAGSSDDDRDHRSADLEEESSNPRVIRCKRSPRVKVPLEPSEETEVDDSEDTVCRGRPRRRWSVRSTDPDEVEDLSDWDSTPGETRERAKSWRSNRSTSPVEDSVCRATDTDDGVCRVRPRRWSVRSTDEVEDLSDWDPASGEIRDQTKSWQPDQSTAPAEVERPTDSDSEREEEPPLTVELAHESLSPPEIEAPPIIEQPIEDDKPKSKSPIEPDINIEDKPPEIVPETIQPVIEEKTPEPIIEEKVEEPHSPAPIIEEEPASIIEEEPAPIIKEELAPIIEEAPAPIIEEIETPKVDIVETEPVPIIPVEPIIPEVPAEPEPIPMDCGIEAAVEDTKELIEEHKEPDPIEPEAMDCSEDILVAENKPSEDISDVTEDFEAPTTTVAVVQSSSP